MALTKAKLARLAFARLREIAPNEAFAAVDQDTIELEIDLCRARLEASIFNGVTLWQSDTQIPGHIAEGFLLCLLPTLATHYAAVTVPPDLAGEGYRELCRQLAKPYRPETINQPDAEPIQSSVYIESRLFMNQGQDFLTVFRLKDGQGNPLDLTDYDVRLQARRYLGVTGTPVLDLSVSAGTLTLTAPGEVTLALTAVQTMGYPTGRFAFELELVNPTLEHSIIQRGTLIITAGVVYD